MKISRRSLIAGLSLFAVGMGFANAAPKATAKDKDSCKAACLACAETCKKCMAEHKGKDDCCNICEACHHMCLACAAADGKEVEAIIRAACEKVCRKCAEHCQESDQECCKVCVKACLACADACKAESK